MKNRRLYFSKVLRLGYLHRECYCQKDLQQLYLSYLHRCYSHWQDQLRLCRLAVTNLLLPSFPQGGNWIEFWPELVHFWHPPRQGLASRSGFCRFCQVGSCENPAIFGFVCTLFPCLSLFHRTTCPLLAPRPDTCAQWHRSGFFVHLGQKLRY